LKNLMSGFFQHAYVTNDMVRAKRQFAERWGVHAFLEFEAPLELLTPRGSEVAVLKIALAFVGDLQVELIEPLSGTGTSIYQKVLPAAGFKVVWHHFGYRLPKHATAWQEFRGGVGNSEFPIAIEGHIRSEYGEVHFAYLDTWAELGHYNEYLWSSYDIDAPVPKN
jgi:hypothetical protein